MPMYKVVLGISAVQDVAGAVQPVNGNQQTQVQVVEDAADATAAFTAVQARLQALLAAPLGASVSVYDGAGGQVFTGTVAVVFDTLVENTDPAVYSVDLSTGAITVLQAGIYEVQFDVSLDNSTNSRVTSHSYLTRNGVAVPGTAAYGYHRNSGNGLMTAAMGTIISLSANDVLAVQAQRLGTSGTVLTVASGSRLNLRRVA